MLADAIACGVDYNDITFCLQSQINTNLLPLFLFFGGLVNLPRIQRLPAIKALIKDDISKISMTTLNFPLIEVIDLLAFRANYVYSNIDNKPFVELANELIERFNRNFEKVFPSPQLVHGKMPFLMGTDGSKMSKSKGNCIFLCDPTDISSSSNVH
jgi:tryptophanyl-tRNA synthetase